jgi:iron complex transport system substrate-binding protein
VVVEALPAERVVSTMQSATEWLVLLGATDRLVARTDFDRQPVLADLPSIGGGLDPSPEAIAALRPDVVLGWLARSSVDLAGALAPFGIPVLGLESTDTADAFGQLALLGRLVGREDRAATLADSLRGELARLRTSSCGTDARYETVLVVISTEPPLTAGPGTWMTELLGVACLRNVFDDLAQAWPQVSLEAIVDRQPRWILTSRGDRPGARQRELLEQAGWRQLAAVQEGRIIELGGDLFARAGVGMAEWVRAVVRGRTIEDQGRPTP